MVSVFFWQRHTQRSRVSRDLTPQTRPRSRVRDPAAAHDGARNKSFASPCVVVARQDPVPHERRVMRLVRCCLMLCLATGVTAQSVILQVGGSDSSQSLSRIFNFCENATVVNRAVAGSTSTDWSSGSTSCGTGGDCRMSEAFSPTYGSGYTHVVMWVGIQDFLTTVDCGLTRATVASRVTAAVNALRSAAPPGIKIVLPAYCNPSSAMASGVLGYCTTLTQFNNLNGGIQDAANAAADVTFIDSAGACGGGPNAYSSETYLASPVALNVKGYCAVYSMPAMQAAMGCGDMETDYYDCSLPAKVYGEKPPHTFPVKSINLHKASPVEWYKQPNVVGAHGLTDAHAVHGCLLADGGYMMAGRFLEGPGSPIFSSFAINLDANGTVRWVWKSGGVANGVSDGANAVLQLPGGGDVIVVGYRDIGGTFQPSITKLRVSDGLESYTACWPSSPNYNLHGAWEMVDLTKDGRAILLAGLTNSPRRDVWQFKSCTSRRLNALHSHAPFFRVDTFSPAPAPGSCRWQRRCRRSYRAETRPGPADILPAPDGGSGRMDVHKDRPLHFQGGSLAIGRHGGRIDVQRTTRIPQTGHADPSDCHWFFDVGPCGFWGHARRGHRRKQATHPPHSSFVPML